MSRVGARRWATVVVALGSVLIGITVFRTSLTDDEPYCYDYGRRIVFAGSFARLTAMDGSKLPVLALNALPERVASWLGLDRAATDPLLRLAPLSDRERDYIRTNLPIYSGRLVTIVFYLLLCVLVFRWGMEVYGPSGALGATTLVAMLPTLLGHAAVVTVDAAATCTILAAVYALSRCLLDTTIERVLVAGVACGVALLVKYSAIGLAPIAVAMVMIRTLTAEPTESKWRVFHAGIASVVLSAVVAAVVLSAGFGFQHPMTRLDELACVSRSMQGLRHWLGTLPLPLPLEFLTGLDRVLQQDQDRSGGGMVYLLGTLSERGFPSYYAVATVLKTPLPFLALLFTRPWRSHRRGTDLVWLAPVLWIGGQMSFSLQSQVGLRYFLLAFPFFALLAGAAWDHGRGRRARQVATLLAVLCVLETVVQCPRYLSYFNQLIGARRNAYQYLADSNLDWDQGRFALWRWEARHRGERYVLEPKYVPRAGTVVVRASEFVGVFDPETYRWLRHAQARSTARFVDTIGDAFLVFEVDRSVERSDPPGERKEPHSPGGAGGTAAERKFKVES